MSGTASLSGQLHGQIYHRGNSTGYCFGATSSSALELLVVGHVAAAAMQQPARYSSIVTLSGNVGHVTFTLQLQGADPRDMLVLQCVNDVNNIVWRRRGGRLCITFLNLLCSDLKAAHFLLAELKHP